MYIFSSFSLDAVDPNAYDAFKASRNLGDVIDRVLKNHQDAANGTGPRKILSVEASLMTPVQPMLVCSLNAHLKFTNYFLYDKCVKVLVYIHQTLHSTD